MTTTRCDRTAAWGALQTAYNHQSHAFDLRQAFAQDAGRFAALSQSAPHVFADLSKNLIDGSTEQLLFELARQTGMAQHRDAMFAGERINSTEERAVMHWLLRTPPFDPAMPAQSVHRHMAETLREVHSTLDAMLAFAETVRLDARITDIVNIGIGGSDLGPQMAVLALDAFVAPGKRFHFVSNVDGHELAGVLRKVNAESTLFLIASKTFTTTETMSNAESAKRWFLRQGGTDIARHFAALTTNVAAVKAFGATTTFGLWDWVGGR